MNYLILCLDSCRLDRFEEANTPNFNKIGKPKKVYSHAGFTAPSIVGLMTNLPPYNEGKDEFIKGFPHHCWLPDKFKERGYFTSFFTPNPTIFANREIFERGFNTLKSIDFPLKNASKEIISEDINVFKSTKEDKFVLNLFMATHRPYAGGNQTQATEIVDKEFGRLLPYLSDTKVIVCADHGELFGEGGGRWHNPAQEAVFHPKLFEVPIVRGMIE